MTPGLRGRLRETGVPDADGARERSWRVVAGAYAEREPVAGRPRRARWAAATAVTACAVAAGLSFTAAGEAVGDWLRAVVRPDPAPPHRVRPQLGPLPGGGRLLVVGGTGAWIVQPDGARRRLGAYHDASFSPRGLYVAVARNRLLAAVDPRGSVRWSLTRPEPVSSPRWSPDGFRVAYRSGSELRVVYGDGALDRRLARGSRAVPPAWQPGERHRLAYVTPAGAVVLRDADSGRIRWRRTVGGPVRQLAWGPGGRRLLAVTPAGVVVLDGRGHLLRMRPVPEGMRAGRVAWLPSGRRFALVRSGPRISDAVLVAADGRRERRVLALPGRLSQVLAAPNGRHLLLAAPRSRQWWLVPLTRGAHITALSDIVRQFDPGGGAAGALPRPVAWIG